MTSRLATAVATFAYPARSGVTMVELLVVMVILSILSSLTLSGLLVARERSRQAKTLSTVRKLSELILPYYEEYETRRPALDQTVVSTIMANGSRNNREILAEYKRIALRRLMSLELSDRPDDVSLLPLQVTLTGFGPAQLVEIPPATRRYAGLIGNKGPVTESSDLLHMIVTRGVVADPDMIAHFRDDEIGDPNGNGLKEFIDGWGRPIRFWRWPVGLNSPLQPITGSPSDIDPLVSTSANSHRLVPLIYSAGRDGLEGINRPPLGANYDPFPAAGLPSRPDGPGFADNIHNHDLRQ